MITQRALLLGFVAFCFYLIAVVNMLDSYFYALTWAAIGVFGASMVLAFLSLIGLSCRLELKRSRSAASLSGEMGLGPTVHIALTNTGTLNKTGTILELRVRDSHDALSIHRILIEAVPSGASIESDVPLHNLKRGTYTIREAKLIGSDVLGLFRIQKRLSLDESKSWNIVIGPAILRSDIMALGGDGAIPAHSNRALQAGRGDELRGTRPYTPGDDLRHVHWKTSARVGELVVKEFEQTGRQVTLVVWDGAADTTWGKGDYDSTEWSLILCASLCRSVLAGGTSCDFARFDEVPLLVQSRSLQSGELPGGLIDALAEANPTRKTPLDAALFEIPSVARRHYSTIYLVTSSLSNDVPRTSLYWRSHGSNPQILLVDGASLQMQGVERRRSPRGGKTKSQNSHGQIYALTEDNYVSQAKTLRETAGHVVLVKSAGESPGIALRTALHHIFDPHGVTMRPVDRSTV